MSHGYENYARTSADYDRNRVPMGLGSLRRILERQRAVAGEARLLDAGCGTGAHLAALLPFADQLVGLELDAGMLGRARSKLAGEQRVQLHQGSVLAVPFGDGEFDVVCFNQVLHHLDGEDGAEADWPHLRRALGESRRVLRPGGALLINTCDQRQLTDGFWYAPLIPQAIGRVARRYIPLEPLIRVLEQLGFDRIEREVPKDEVFYGARALDPRGPFDPVWRNGDSVWALTPPQELQAALARLRSMLDAGEVEGFLAGRECVRRDAGQCTIVHARRA